MPHPAAPSPIEHFAAPEDPRQSWKVLHPLPEVLLVVLCGTLAGAEDLVEIRQWAGISEAFLRGFATESITQCQTLNLVPGGGFEWSHFQT